jgi:hypothetical protein
LLDGADATSDVRVLGAEESQPVPEPFLVVGE